MIIREERAEDSGAVHRVEALAFGRKAEADLVDVLRTNGKVSLSLVAEVDGQVVGHVLFSPVRLETAEGTVSGQGLGPLAVLPEFQKQGVGSALARAGIERLRAAGYAWAIVEGSPQYYPRFGFRDAAPLGIACQFNPPPGCFMALELAPGALQGLHGMVYYADEFLSVG